MHCSLFLILFATVCLGSYTCCAAGQIARSSDGWSGTIIRNLVFAVCKPTKTWRHFPSRRKIVRRSPRAQRLAIIPSFTSTAYTLREKFASRQKRLYENIYRDYWLPKTSSHDVQPVKVQCKVMGKSKRAAKSGATRRRAATVNRSQREKQCETGSQTRSTTQSWRLRLHHQRPQGATPSGHQRQLGLHRKRTLGATLSAPQT